MRAGSTCIVCANSTGVILESVYDVRFGVPGLFQIRQCHRCGLEQTVPILEPDELLETYERFYNFRNHDTAHYTSRRQQLLKARLYRPWVRVDGDISFILRSGGGRRLLDVGCNEGRNLVFYRAQGFNAEGVETNPAAAATAAALGFRVHLGELGTLPTVGRRFDVIVLSNILEHVPDPLAMLEEAHRRLVPSGEVWVSCPNANSFARRWFGRSWINWHPPFHLAHFTAEGLIGLLHRAGFETTEVEYLSPALWIAQSLIAWRYARPEVPTLQLRKPAIMAPLMVAIRGILFPLLWAANHRGRGDCLRVTARRSPEDRRSTDPGTTQVAPQPDP